MTNKNKPTDNITEGALERVIEKAKSHAGSFCNMDEYKQNEADCLALRVALQNAHPGSVDVEREPRQNADNGTAFDADFQNDLCGILDEYGVTDIYSAETSIWQLIKSRLKTPDLATPDDNPATDDLIREIEILKKQKSRLQTELKIQREKYRNFAKRAEERLEALEEERNAQIFKAIKL